jgi:hypothetical protein
MCHQRKLVIRQSSMVDLAHVWRVLGLCVAMTLLLSGGACQEMVEPTTQISTPVGPAEAESVSQSLTLTILSLPSSTRAGEQVVLRVGTVSPALVKAEVYYPRSNEPVRLEGQRVGPDGEAAWTWTVPAETPSGEARIIVTASVVGKDLTARGILVVE